MQVPERGSTQLYPEKGLSPAKRLPPAGFFFVFHTKCEKASQEHTGLFGKRQVFHGEALPGAVPCRAVYRSPNRKKMWHLGRSQNLSNMKFFRLLTGEGFQVREAEGSQRSRVNNGAVRICRHHFLTARFFRAKAFEEGQPG